MTAKLKLPGIIFVVVVIVGLALTNPVLASWIYSIGINILVGSAFLGASVLCILYYDLVEWTDNAGIFAESYARVPSAPISEDLYRLHGVVLCIILLFFWPVVVTLLLSNPAIADLYTYILRAFGLTWTGLGFFLFVAISGIILGVIGYMLERKLDLFPISRHT